MSDEQTAEPLAVSLPVTGELGELVREHPTEVAPPAAASSPTPVRPPSDDDTYLPTFVGETHSYITQYIQNADQKAVFLSGVAAALLAFLHQDRGSAWWLKPLAAWGFLSAVTLVAMLALAGAAIAAVAVIVPRLPGRGRGAVSFLGIAAYETPDEYAQSLLRTSGPALLAEKAQHCHTLAQVCCAKYRVLRIAVVLEALGMIAAVVYLVFARTGAA